MKPYRAKGTLETVKEWVMWRGWSSCQISPIFIPCVLQNQEDVMSSWLPTNTQAAVGSVRHDGHAAFQPLGAPQQTYMFTQTWNPPVCIVGRWHVSPCKTASLIMEERQRGLATTIRPLRKPHFHPTPWRPQRRSDIRSNFLQLVLSPVAVVSAICQLIQMPLMILQHCPLRAKEAAFEDTVRQVTL